MSRYTAGTPAASSSHDARSAVVSPEAEPSGSGAIGVRPRSASQSSQTSEAVGRMSPWSRMKSATRPWKMVAASPPAFGVSLTRRLVPIRSSISPAETYALSALSGS